MVLEKTLDNGYPFSVQIQKVVIQIMGIYYFILSCLKVLGKDVLLVACYFTSCRNNCHSIKILQQY